MTYLKRLTLTQQQNELQKIIDERLNREDSKVKERVYQWLNNNQYFVDNELFDFYFCVAQNIAAVEILGGSGEKIVNAKIELEESAKAYTTQIVDISNLVNKQLKEQLHIVQKNQHQIDTKLIEVLSGLAREHENLQIISNGLINSISVLQKKQKQLLVQTELARRSTFNSVIIAWIIPAIVLLGCLAMILVMN